MDYSAVKTQDSTYHIDDVNNVVTSLPNKRILDRNWILGVTFQWLLKLLYGQFTKCWVVRSTSLEKGHRPRICAEVWLIYNRKQPLQLHLPEEAVNIIGFLQEKASFKNRIKANRTTKFRSALGKSAVLREKSS